MGKVISINRNNNQTITGFLNRFPTFNLGSLTISIVIMMLMIIATFTLLPVGLYDPEMIINPGAYFTSFNNILLTLHSHLYSPQIPIAIFAGALLGSRLGSFSIILYVVAGLIGFPFFASGGGFNYVFEPTFGFIIGFVFAAYFVGKIFSGNVNSLMIIFAALMGVITVHFLGVGYLIFQMFYNGIDIAVIKAWVWSLSFINLPYDILLSLVLVAIARPLRGLLWIVLH